MPNLIPFPSKKRNQPDAPTLNVQMTLKDLELLDLLTRKRDLLSRATCYLEALSTSLKCDIDAVPHHPMSADGRSVQKA